MFLDLIKSCTSVKKYDETKIPEEDLRYILGCGMYTPDEEDDQPCLFGVVDDKDLLEELSRCCRNQRWIAGTSCAIAVCTRRMSEENLEIEKYRLGKLHEEVYDINPNVLDILCAREHTAMSAAQKMALAACERNIGSCIISYLDVFRASKILKVPNSHLVTYLLTLGYPPKASAERNVNPSEGLVFHNRHE